MLEQLAGLQRAHVAYQNMNRSRNSRSAVVKRANNSLQQAEHLSISRPLHRIDTAISNDNGRDVPINAPFSCLLCLLQLHCFETIIRGC